MLLVSCSLLICASTVSGAHSYFNADFGVPANTLLHEVSDSAAVTQPMKGMTLNAWSYEAYNSSDFDQSIENLADTGANWILFTVFWFMDKYTDTDMHPRPELYTASESSLIHAIQKAHQLNMNVSLKPMVDVLDGYWRGQIQPSDWTLWFDNYRSFINHYADLAETNHVELYVVGTELRSSQIFESQWRQVIGNVSARFDEKLTYAANWDSYGTGQIRFWDALDYVGVDAYFPLTSMYSPTAIQLTNAWEYCTRSGYVGRSWTNELFNVHLQTGKQVLFTEIGYCSQNGTNISPWDWNISPIVDTQEQADCYHAALEALKPASWFEGWFWWNWETDPNAGGPTERHYTPQNKPAQQVISQYYLETHPDIALLSIVPLKQVSGRGRILPINVTMENQGASAENCNLTVYANNTAISFEEITLENMSRRSQLCLWNIGTVSFGNYSISAQVTPLESEIDISDNTASSVCAVCVTIAGDVDVDFDVDILDVVKIAGIYSSKTGDPSFIPEFDLNDDLVVNMLDIVICTVHYGQRLTFS
jgi:hypothetical protein